MNKLIKIVLEGSQRKTVETLKAEGFKVNSVVVKMTKKDLYGRMVCHSIYPSGTVVSSSV